LASMPALPQLRIPQQPELPDYAGNFERLAQLSNSLQTGQMQRQGMQQEQQLQSLTIQQKQQEVKDQQTLRTLSPNFITKDPSGKVTGYDYDGLFNQAAQSGVSPQTLSTFQKSISEAALAKANVSKAQLENEGTVNSQAFNHLDGLRGIQDPAQRQQAWGSALQWAQQNAGTLKTLNIDPTKLPQQAPDDNGLNLIEASLGMHAQQLADAAKVAKTGKDQADATKSRGVVDPTSPLYAPTPAAVAMGTAPGASQIQAGEAKLAGDKAAAEAKARQPYEMSLARQRQALSQGDPNAAGQLLVNGDATLSELKARGATPEFIARTLFAARKLSNGQYNAQSADAQFSVAKSPANVAFFGSAKSLTDKGGTLDQLAAAAKDIPSSQIPALNSIADWTKAATGSGPLAKYAAIALGSADDYSKVMSGGNGSDTSRMQALNLFKQNLSPEGRAGSIEGVRGSVNSQIVGRIGKNPVLQRMYGDAGGAASPSSLVRARDPQGNLHQAPAGTALPKGWKLE
jgi:hypothetical protein